MALTQRQVHLFRHNGFVKLPDPLPLDLVDRLKDAIRADIRNGVGPVQKDPGGNVVRISNILSRGPVFREAVTHPHALEPLACLLGPNIDVITNRHNHATLRTRSAYSAYGDLHRDVLQWSRTIVTLIFYLETTTVENGCTLVIPGSHTLSWTGESLYDREAYAEIAGQAVPVPMPAGGMLAIDSTVVHGVGENRTDGTRMSMTVGYHSVDELMDADTQRPVG
jgi:ectoine hydroxylase-related dioxygenase (phytanoyl-CoA dioxygenase family)